MDDIQYNYNTLQYSLLPPPLLHSGEEVALDTDEVLADGGVGVAGQQLVHGALETHPHQHIPALAVHTEVTQREQCYLPRAGVLQGIDHVLESVGGDEVRAQSSGVAGEIAKGASGIGPGLVLGVVQQGHQGWHCRSQISI